MRVPVFLAAALAALVLAFRAEEQPAATNAEEPPAAAPPATEPLARETLNRFFGPEHLRTRPERPERSRCHACVKPRGRPEPEAGNRRAARHPRAAAARDPVHGLRRQRPGAPAEDWRVSDVVFSRGGFTDAARARGIRRPGRRRAPRPSIDPTEQHLNRPEQSSAVGDLNLWHRRRRPGFESGSDCSIRLWEPPVSRTAREKRETERSDP